ncbi:MAG: glycoside hydrolase family 2 TIM barrel-domain containing protein [Spirochaetota bacterium]
MQTDETMNDPRSVAVVEQDGRYRFYVDGEEFFAKGAGGGFSDPAELSRHGANSMRTWTTRDARRILDDAEQAGIMVLMGIDVARERHGFDYDDPQAVAEQLERIRNEVTALRKHPALLAWGIGNELNLSATNPRVWDAVNGIASMIHEVDPNHPTTTMLAGVAEQTISEIKRRAPELDFLSIQMYGTVSKAKELIRRAGYDGPYLITEWGATGHWEVPATEWGAPVEQTSSEKADAILDRYRTAVLGDPDRCMGSYVFLWGQKQERTPTWYGLITESGRKTEAIDVMEYVWTGSWPAHRAPRVTGVTIDGQGRYDSVRLTAGTPAKARLEVELPDGEQIDARAEVLPEATVLGEGGDFEPRPEPVPGAIDDARPDSVSFTAPSEPGPYRLFVYLDDEHAHAATANLPFMVE